MKSFTNDDIKKLRDLPIESVAERLGLKVKMHKSLCPFHEDRHPSLSFDRRRNMFKCWACGASGDTIDLAMKVLNVEFVDACKWLADEHNVIVTEYVPQLKPVKSYPPDVRYLQGLMRYPVLTDEAKTFLFDTRHYDPKVVEWLGISSITTSIPCWSHGKPFYDGPSLLFPYRDLNGNVMNVQSRYLGDRTTTEGQYSIPRFRFPANSSIHVFNLPILRWLKEDEPLYVSEGVTDCMAYLSERKKAIAIPSATTLKPEDFALLRSLHKCLNLHVFPDNDEAGEKLYKNLLSVANEIGACLTRHDLPEGCKDYSELFRALPVTCPS